MRGSVVHRKKGKKGGSPESIDKTRSQTNFTHSKSSATIQSRVSKRQSRKRLSTVKKGSIKRNRNDANNTIEYTGLDGTSQMVVIGGPPISTKQQQH